MFIITRFHPKNSTMLRTFLLLLFSLFLFQCTQNQPAGNPLTVDLTVAEAQAEALQAAGRLFLFLNEDARVEPRTRIWPSNGNYIFARNLDNFTGSLSLSGDQDWISTAEWDLDHLPPGEYYAQVLWDQDTQESRINAPGNLYSAKQKITIPGDQRISLQLDQIIPPHEIVEHELVRAVDMESDTLSQWWGKPMRLKASVLLPPDYDPARSYPIRYNVSGYGGRYYKINRIVQNQNFMQWWTSAAAPRVINVFLDGEGPFGDSYQMDSENSGPYGYALINELIPHIETRYRGTQSAETRFVDGCSTGGWVSLGLQLYYPETFNGVFSYSPDAIEFENYQLINIYEDENAFTNEYGYLRPVWRETSGEPVMSLKKFIQYENVLGSSDTYLNSGGQFSAHTALYSPKGDNGLPQPLFDPYTGEIDPEVAEHWQKYDFKKYAEKNWPELGPKLQGKIYIWMGDMDNFYLNLGTRAFDDFLKGTTNPKSDAEVVFTPEAGHCDLYSNRVVLEQVQERLAEIRAY